MVKKEAIIIYGAPGSGKGTQGKLLEKNTDFKRYVMSDLIKLELKPESELYDKIINKGNLMSDEDVCRIFEKYFKNENNIILDGIPRKEKQAKWLYDFLLEKKYNIKFLYLKNDIEELLNRIQKRKKLENRKDDNDEIFENRIKLFKEPKESILNIFKNKIIEINGDGKVEDISKKILKKIK